MHDVTERLSIPLIVAMLFAGSLSILRADTLHLKNGRILEGIIEAETDSYVALNMGVGSIRIQRSRIAAIGRSEPEETGAIEKSWKEQYYTHDRFAPEAQRDLAQGFRELDGRQREAAVALDDIHRIRAAQPELRKEMSALEQDMVAVSRQLAGADPERDVQAYNALVGRNNTLGARLVVFRDQYATNEKTAESDMRTVAEYIRAFDTYRETFDQRYQAHQANGAPTDERHFFESIRAEIERLGAQLQDNVIPFEPYRGGHAVVEAKINDAGTVSLMLDTGASVITLSDTAARRLNLELTGKSNAEFKLADGTVVEAETVVLDSVEVGDARVEEVLAAVLPSSAATERDGLLGMSFLREFVLQYDATGRRMSLKRLIPQ